ncbi:MAG: sulfotransferase [Gammaproteobacteria bacterium]|nr:sulfotransferase [Gammaproteobacteria bacterium]
MLAGDITARECECMNYSPSYQDMLVKITTLIQEGELVKAKQLCAKAMKKYHGDHNFVHLRGIIALMSGVPQEAIKYLRMLADDGIKDANVYSNLGNAYLQCNKSSEAIRALKIATSNSIGESAAEHYYNLGCAYIQIGRSVEAQEAYLEAEKLKPNSEKILYAIGRHYYENGSYRNALQYVSRAFQIAPDNVTYHLRYANTLCKLGEEEQAADEFEKVIDTSVGELLPYAEYLEAMRERENNNLTTRAISKLRACFPDKLLAVVMELEHCESINDILRAKTLIKKYDQELSNNVRYKLVKSKVIARDGAYDEAVDILETVAHRSKTAPVYFMLADLYHKEGNHEKAFKNFEKANVLAAQEGDAKKINRDFMLKRINKLSEATVGKHAHFDNKLEKSRRSPVFLYGFPRSGTTLLDQFLYNHSGIQVMEEKPPLLSIELIHEKQFGLPTIDTLTMLDDVDRQRLLHTYYEKVRGYIDLDESKILIDKGPYNTIRAGFIETVFKHPKVIFSIRHPCDVILSCFMQNFFLHEASINFTSFGKSVDFYVKVMNLWKSYNEAMSLNVFPVKYEELVADTESVMLGVVEFLGLSWNEELLDHIGGARKRGIIRTASYSQVVQPIYKSAIHRWRKYERHFEPHMEKIAPIIEYFGYDL